MRHAEFVFVDFAVNGANKRNHVVQFDQLSLPEGAVDCYTTVYRFDERFKELVESTGSVKGADHLPCWTDSIHFDIDRDNDRRQAFADALAILAQIEEIHPDLAEATTIYFSGNKGVHLHLPIEGLEPSVDLPQRIRETAKRIAGDIEIDSVYEHSRLWRIPGTKHAKTGLFKVPLTREQLEQLTSGKIEIESIAKTTPMSQRIHEGRIDSDTAVDPAAWSSLAALIVDASSDIRPTKAKKSPPKGWEAPPKSESLRQIQTERLQVLLEHGCRQSTGGGVAGKATGRDNSALLRADKCRECGYNQEEALDLLNEWNELNAPPLAKSDLKRVIASAYDGEPHDIGFSDKFEELKAAHQIASQNGGKPSPEPRAQSKLRQILSEMPISMECDGIRIYDIVDLIKEPALIAPPETAVLGCAIYGSNTILAGDSGTGKSTFVRSGVIQEAMQGKRTLWLSAEMERRAPWWFNRMYPHIKKGQIVWFDTRFQDPSVSTLTPEQRYNALCRIAEKCNADFLIIDTLLSLLTWIDGDVPPNEEMARWGHKVQKLGEIALQAGSTPLILHHTNKEGKYALSAGIKNACDNMWVYERVGGNNPDLRNLKVLKTRDGVKPYTVECSPDNDYHYKVRDEESAPDWSSRPKYPKSHIPLLQALATGEPLKRSNLQQLGRIKNSSTMTRFKDKYAIEAVSSDNGEQWQATPEQVEEWCKNGIEPATTNPNDHIKHKSEE